MQRIVAEALRAGALGFTTSRTRNHRTSAGDPIPSLRAKEAELAGIAHALAETDSGVMQIISDFSSRQGDEFGMLVRVVKASARPRLQAVPAANPDTAFAPCIQRMGASRIAAIRFRGPAVLPACAGCSPSGTTG